MKNAYVIYNGQLYHHGIKGMKWGVRKDKNKKHVRRKSKRDQIKSMSDEELNKKINRLQKENQYRQLTENKGIAAGKKIVSTILVGSITGVGTYYLSRAMKGGINKSIPVIVEAAKKVVGTIKL